MLRLVLPKGSLERATIELFEAADLSVIRGSDVDYRATIKDHRIGEVRVLRPQEIPEYVAEGLFDLGITGRDWVLETGADVVEIAELPYAKQSLAPVRWVLAVPEEAPVHSPRACGDRGAIKRSSPPAPMQPRDGPARLLVAGPPFSRCLVPLFPRSLAPCRRPQRSGSPRSGFCFLG